MSTTAPSETTARYSEAWRTVRWPGEAKVAVQVILAFESFERQSQFATAPSPNAVNGFSQSYGEYGAHAGAWRLLRLFAEEDISVSVPTNGLAAARHPHVVRAIADAGHELVGHGWANDVFLPGGDDERRMIAETLDAIERAGGQRPVGWTSPGKMGSPDSDELLLDAGILYTGDDASDDLPFVKEVGERSMVVVPSVDLNANDLLQWILPGHGPAVLADSFKRTFDAVYHEAVEGRPNTLGLVLHAHGAGRPTMVPTVRELIRYAKGHADVWFARGDEIARWTVEQGYRR
ncbi:polysaccharide deacetylase family protein [Conexibacter stalactiti]|uniref:Polysaccharide deacetylase family protein n=1 Tax=Conexibacter stalactiti TaxID=1940611 RepID=A0ABU4HJD3_9ACTN|nr:polysaccharide deacetylase family protein [Conexibacter stalactiti]MDW5593428.1 polysaccharide deacetylase family protein [Conexibacter stalactiti]MEC5034069.1 polysaccharide deacetylase family protein [Conexibacter stalactiti]